MCIFISKNLIKNSKFPICIINIESSFIVIVYTIRRGKPISVLFIKVSHHYFPETWLSQNKSRIHLRFKGISAKTGAVFFLMRLKTTSKMPDLKIQGHLN